MNREAVTPTPSEWRTGRGSPFERVPNLMMGIVVLFLLVFAAGTTIYPQQVFSEYAPRWQSMLWVLALVALVAAAGQGLRLRRLAGVLAPLLLLLYAGYLATVLGPFPWAGTDWLATLLQGVLSGAIGGVLGLHFSHRGADGRRRLALGLTAAGTALLLFYVLDAAHQHAVRFPRTLRELGPTPGDSEFERLVYDALAGGRLSSRLGNPNVLAAVLCMFWPLGAALWLSARGWWLGLGVATLLFGGVPAVLFTTGSRGGILTAVGGLALVCILWRREIFTRRRLVEAAGGLAIGLALAGLVVLASPSRPAAQEPAEDASLAGRFARPSTITMRLGFLSAGLDMLPENWRVGGGAGSFESLYLAHQSAGRQESKYAHHWPLQFLIEAGLLGLLAGVALLVAVVFYWRLALRSEETAGGAGGAGPRTEDELAVDFGRLLRLVPAALFMLSAVFWANGLVEITPYIREPYIWATLMGGVLAGWCSRRAAAARPASGGPAWAPVVTLGLFLLLLVPVGWPIHRRVQAQGILEAARQGPWVDVTSAFARGMLPFDSSLAQLEDAAAQARTAFPLSPEPYLLDADVAELFVRAAAQPDLEIGERIDAGDWLERARGALLRARELSPRSASILARLARLQTDPERALSFLERAIVHHPAEPDYRAEMARLLIAQADAGVPPAEARALLERAQRRVEEAMERDYREDRMEEYRGLERQIELRLQGLPAGE